MEATDVVQGKFNVRAGVGDVAYFSEDATKHTRFTNLLVDNGSVALNKL